MTFDELKEIFRAKYDITKLADMARELNVSPQLLNSWKLKDRIPEKYINLLKSKELDRDSGRLDNSFDIRDNQTIIMKYPIIVI